MNQEHQTAAADAHLAHDHLIELAHHCEHVGLTAPHIKAKLAEASRALIELIQIIEETAAQHAADELAVITDDARHQLEVYNR